MFNLKGNVFCFEGELDYINHMEAEVLFQKKRGISLDLYGKNNVSLIHNSERHNLNIKTLLSVYTPPSTSLSASRSISISTNKSKKPKSKKIRLNSIKNITFHFYMFKKALKSLKYLF
ncbi:MAG: hypothetical protein BAJALOKI1v1_220027 [Promethearchaeota archaeon]|nr:MAG: hypothetical protein BAJALOKI1v1_220027 [Candidatus Lokiarchaeota archaeon]